MYYGNQPNYQQYPVDRWTSNVTTYALGYPLTYNPGSALAISVSLNGLEQIPNIDYSVSNQVLTFTPAIPDGLSILVRYLGIAGTVVSVPDLSITPSKIAETILSKTVTGGTVALSAAEATNYSIYEFSGTLVSACTIQFPTTVNLYVVNNKTSGSIAITTTTGSGITLPQGMSTTLYCDGTNIVNAEGLYLTQLLADARYAGLASPALTGVPTAPTAPAGTNTTQLATTAHVYSVTAPLATASYVAAAIAPLAPKASPVFTGTVLASDATDATSATSGALQSSGGLGVVKSIYAGGNVTAYSDIRIKTDIVKIQDALSKVSRLNGYTYKRTDIDIPRQTGVIAQEVLAVLPEAVMGSEDTLYSVAYGNLVGLLIEAIKELSNEVDLLKAK